MHKTVEGLDVWQQAMEVAHRVRAVLRSSEYRGDLDMRSQMRRAAVSIPSNIAEGYEKGSVRDSIKFYRIAKGSASELRTQLLLCKRGGDLPVACCDELVERTLSVSRSLAGFIRYLQKAQLAATTRDDPDNPVP